ncbi:MAG: MMPL family transporter [Candidatus Wenzhouxiangella sp. M2_3B_020]
MTEEPPRTSFVEAWLTRITQHPLLTLALCVAAALAAAWIAANSLGVNSDAIAMLDEDLPFRQTDERLRAEFPNLDNNLLAVVEAPTPEQATLAARRVADRLRGMDEVDGWSWPAGSPFFARNGLLFLSLSELEALGETLTEAQPLLGRLARSTDAAALFELLAQIAERGAAAPGSFDSNPLYARIAAAVDAALDDAPRLLSWQQLLGGGEADGPAREVLLINPVLDHQRVLAGREVMQAMAGMRTELGLDAGATRLYFTGSTALQYEEMRSVIAGAGLTGLLALILVSAVMLAGLRSIPMSLIALANLALGLALTAGFAAMAIGRVNLISVSFVVLYIGLGVNYAVHYLLRYREIAQGEYDERVTAARATITAGRFLRAPLLLSAVTTALGFFAFVPTSFSGVAQLGLIAGAAMAITLALSYTALPAMLALFRPKVRSPVPDPAAGWRRGLEWPLKHRRAVLVLGALLAVAALPALPEVRFDTDPLNVRDPQSESVVTIRSLLAEPGAGYRNIQVLLEPGTEAEPLRRRLEDLEAVDRAVTLTSLVPGDQSDKLFIIEDLGWVLGPGIVEADWSTDPVEPAALEQAALRLETALASTGGDGAGALSVSLDRLQRQLASDAGDAAAADVNRTLTAGLEPTLGRLSAGLRADEPVTRDDLPDWLVEQWRGESGARLIQVFPAVDVLEPAGRRAFTEQVVSIAGARATGGPVIQFAAGEAITDSFRQALVWAVIGIAAVLLLTLRSVLAAARVMAPLALGGLLTLASMVLLGIPFNFANVVALPLLLGVAVDNGIHLVARHRAGLLPDGNVLKTATARAIVVGAMITAGGFGNLAFSPHSGTASLGMILAIGLTLMVVATLVFLPAMLGRGR